MRLKSNNSLMDLIQPHLKRPVGRPSKSGIQTKLIDFYYRAGSWDRPRRVICRIEWHEGELFPRIGFIVANSKLAAGKAVKVYNGRAEIENRINEGKKTLRRDKTSCTRFEATQARFKTGVLAYNLLLHKKQYLPPPHHNPPAHFFDVYSPSGSLEDTSECEYFTKTL